MLLVKSNLIIYRRLLLVSLAILTNIIDTNRTHKRKEGILEARITTLTSLVEVCHVKILFYDHSQNATQCRHKTAQCDTLIFGSLVRRFLSTGVWPGKPAELASALHGTSVQNLSEQMLAFKYDQLPRSGSYEDHDSCVLTSQLSGPTRDVLKKNEVWNA